MTAAPSSPTTRAPGAAAARTRSAGPTATIRSSRTSIDRAGPELAAIVMMSASVSSTSTVQPSTGAAVTGLAPAPHRSHPAARCGQTAPCGRLQLGAVLLTLLSPGAPDGSHPGQPGTAAGAATGRGGRKAHG